MAENRAPPLAAALLMTLWANLHGGFAFGLALVVPFALEAVVAANAGQRTAAARGWALFGAASLVAAAVNPFGIEGLLFPVRLMGLHALAQINEWGPESFAHPKCARTGAARADRAGDDPAAAGLRRCGSSC